MVYSISNDKELKHKGSKSDRSQLSVFTAISTEKEFCKCEHRKSEFGKCIVSIGDLRCCGLLDTGAQVSLVTQRLVEEMKLLDKNLVIEESGKEILSGIGEVITETMGIIRLRPKILGITVDSEIPFVIVNVQSMPCCMILGINI